MDLIRYKVTGTVQGVFFRQTTQQEANKLGLRGWCHNHPDSSVEGVAVGPSDKIKQFHSYLQQGPPQAQVRGVELIEEKAGVSEDEIKQALGTESSGYEVRRHKG